MKKTLSIILFFYYFLNISCGDVLDSKLVVTNFTNKNLIVDYGEYYHKKDSNYFTTQSVEVITSLNFYTPKRSHYLKQMTTGRLQEFGTTFEEIINNSFNKKLNLFVFEVDSVLKYKDMNLTYQQKAYYTILRLSLNELISNDWIVEIK